MEEEKDFTLEELKELEWCVNNSTCDAKHLKIRDTLSRKLNFRLGNY